MTADTDRHLREAIKELARAFEIAGRGKPVSVGTCDRVTDAIIDAAVAKVREEFAPVEGMKKAIKIIVDPACPEHKIFILPDNIRISDLAKMAHQFGMIVNINITPKEKSE